ncbi:MAG: hypothetical protein ACM3H7_06475, partial [Acidobacteriaceae bacterium]
MKLKFSGTVCYANGDPAPDVIVRIFDKDASGKGDDDLTVSPGTSDEHGKFTVTYEPLRYLDYHTTDASGTPAEPFNATSPGIQLPDLGDIYQPYLQFNYTYNSLSRQHAASLGIFQKTFNIPENPAVDFLPSTGGFKFRNSFAGYFLPFSTPAFMGVHKVTSKYGLCGGMSAAAYDFALAGREIPSMSSVPSQGSRLQRYLFQRQMDSLGGMGQQAVKVAQWTSFPDDTLLGTQARTAEEFSSIRQKLDDRNLVVLALIYEHAGNIKELARLIFNNHQVLAYACQVDPSGDFITRVYD